MEKNKIKILKSKYHLVIDSNIKSEKKRNYGIDLFKILATINIVILHINLCSKLINLNPSDKKYREIWSLEIFCYWGVNGFGLISGFVGYKRYKFSNLIYLWFEVFFYSIIISIILFLRKEISKKDLYFSFLPILIKRHWYFNAYFSMYLFLPLINVGIEYLKKYILRNIVIFFILFFSFYNIIAKLFNKNEMSFLNNGYSTTWITILYIIGGYFGKYEKTDNKKINFFFFWIFIYLFSSFFTIGIYLRISKLKFNIPNNLFISYLSPTILLQAISLLKFFSKLEIHNNLIKKVILFLNPLNFSVILIHGRLFSTNNIFVKKSFNSIRNYKENVFLIIYLFGILTYIICILFDYLRLFLFKLLKIRYFCVLIENLFKTI